MTSKDVKQVHKLLNKYLQDFTLHIQFTADEVSHFFVPRDNVVESYVIENKGVITDFMSFYSLPSSILKHPSHSTLHVAYSYYNVAKTVELKDIMHNVLHLAKEKGYDVFNCLDV